LKHWISENYNELKNICSKFSTTEEVDDLLHLCLEEFMKNKRVTEIPDEQKIYFFTKIVRNQYNSESSKYHYTYRKYKFNDMVEADIPEIEYTEDQFNMEWVQEQLKTIDWYYARLFQLYIDEGCSVTKLSKRTTIPINSVSRDINKVRRQLKQLRNGMRM
jgi:DNA-directed RNA polymerase specialized sigma24 family protein